VWFRISRSVITQRLRLPSALGHALKDDRAVHIHALGASLQGRGQDGCETRRRLPADVSGCGLVVVTARLLRTINAGTPFHDVEVELQNAPFTEDHFGDRHQRDLCALAEHRAARSEEQVFDELLGDGGSSASALALEVLLGGDLDLVPIESMVLVEARVLGSDDRVLEIGRDLAERNELVALVIGREVNPGLQAALDVHRGGGRVDPAEGHKHKGGQRPEKGEADDQPPNHGSEVACRNEILGGASGVAITFENAATSAQWERAGLSGAPAGGPCRCRHEWPHSFFNVRRCSVVQPSEQTD